MFRAQTHTAQYSVAIAPYAGWLAAAGFDIQATVRVRVMQGCLVVTVDQPGQESAEG